MKELTSRYVTSLPIPEKTDYVNDIGIYDLCGYLLKARPCVTDCAKLQKTVICNELDLPVDFKIIESHFEPIGQMYSDNSLQECIVKVSQATIIPFFYDHRDIYLPYLIREYIAIRYHFESKRLKNILLSKNKAEIKASAKKSRMNGNQNQTKVHNKK